MDLVTRWEKNRSQFEELPKAEFDELCRAKRFIDGPKVSRPNKWAKEFGPYNPQRWAIGQLNDGRYVCSDVTV